MAQQRRGKNSPAKGKESGVAVFTPSKEAAGKGKEVLNPVTTHYEFSGPYFTPVVVIGMLLTPILLVTLCNKDGCPAPWVLEPASWKDANVALESLKRLVAPKPLAQMLDRDSFIAIIGWLVLHIAFYKLLPGPIAEGTVLRDGKTRLKYPINGFRAFVTVVSLTIFAARTYGLAPFLWVADNYFNLAVASIVLSLGQSLLLYLASFRSKNVMLALGGNTGNPLYDFFIGRELNPRLFGIDFKYMMELRPGLIGWALLDLCLAIRQGTELAFKAGVAQPGVVDALFHVTNAMWLVVGFHTFYVIDALWNERAILTTMDITTDGFGFMLNFGDLVWVPFTYSLQARYLSFTPIVLSHQFVMYLLGLKLIGLGIFRGSNGEKNAFRTDPNHRKVKHLKYLQTESGSKLLISGWWGVARHINYTGDWLMALSWCLPTCFDTPITYFYAIYFAILLWHRELRDEEKCRKKYGRDWDKYCEIVRYRFVPYIY
ncbi:erg24, C-14 sterol reductase [Phlyctochytrium bullatum]|nr:erg24, C-14 sterol reductase [Phlyctochytrium bullatum]